MPAYPMPRIDDLIDRLEGAKYIITLDLTRGYWQVPMAKESQPLTAFATPFGLYQFRVMPFGLSGAPATFQRLVDGVIRWLEDFSAAYLDDLIIYSTRWKEHLHQLRAVFGHLRDAGLTAKPRKCQFGMSHCVYLGHVVGGGVVRPEPPKLEAVRTLPIPQTTEHSLDTLDTTANSSAIMRLSLYHSLISQRNQHQLRWSGVQSVSRHLRPLSSGYAAHLCSGVRTLKKNLSCRRTHRSGVSAPFSARRTRMGKTTPSPSSVANY